MTLEEINIKIKETEEAQFRAREEGDLRENTEWLVLTSDLQRLYSLKARIETDEIQKRKLVKQWHPPTKKPVDRIVMGVKLYMTSLDKPVVIIPKFEFETYKEEYKDLYICSTSSDFSIRNLGKYTYEVPDLIRMEVF